MTRDANLPREPQLRIRVTQRAALPAASDGAWTPFAGDILTGEPHCSMAEGDRVAGFGPAGAEIVVPWWVVVPVPRGAALRDAALLALAELAARTAPVVVDTTGDPAVILSVFDQVPRRGRVVLVGASGGRTADVDFYRTVHQRGLEVTGVDDSGLLSAIGTDQDDAGAPRSA